eukprot:evm.model.scf_1260EXC.2 EVM.evm.TU.scf_1260EXC.2   scf_1260EXC:4199-6425(-)
MASRQCSVREYGHQQLEAQLHSGSYVDLVVFVSEGDADDGGAMAAIKAHRMVLACWSPVLKELIDRAASERHRGWILLQGCQPDAVRDVVRMLYRGQVCLSEANVWGVRRVAVRLKLQPVAAICDKYIRDSCSEKNCLEWMQEAKAQECAALEDMALDMAARSFNLIRQSEEFVQLGASDLRRLLDSQSLQALSEKSVLEAVLRWERQDPQNRSDRLQEVLPHAQIHLTNKGDLDGVYGSTQTPLHGLVRQAPLQGVSKGLAAPWECVLKPGVHLDVPITAVRQCGWKLQLAASYKDPTSEQDLLSIKGDYLLVGACKRGEGKIALCAMGRRDKILAPTGPNEVVFENGLFWYMCPDKAFGFAPTAKIDLFVADREIQDGAKRLSWHIHRQAGTMGYAGGFRAGNAMHLDQSTTWMKLVYSMWA